MDRCPKCPGKYKCIGFDGPVNSPFRFIGEAPGWDEERSGQCFKGKTGREVNEGYMPLAGLKRVNIRIGNAIGCLPDTPQNKLKLDKPKHLELLESCANHRLYPELAAYPPALIIPMGAFACYAIDPDINLELQHGIPIETPRGMVFPMYHPAGGIHEPKKMLHIRTDWYRLRQYIRGTLGVAFDSFEGQEDYGVCRSQQEIYDDLIDMEHMPLACDTETDSDGKPYCLSYTVRHGRGRIIMADDAEGLEQFQYHLDTWDGPILWHNWLFDEGVTRKMGLRFKRRLIVDTMVRVFHLGNLPQGLKALSYRELGMKMLDFDDLVTPHSKPRALAYLGDVAREDWPKPPKVSKRQDDGSYKDSQPHSIKTKVKTFFTNLAKNPDKDPFDMWNKAWADDQKEIEEKCGKFPRKCIRHAAEDDFERVVWYACRDADALLRFYEVLRWMESRVRKYPQEQWRDVA